MPPKEKQTPGANYGFIENLVRCGGAYSRSQETDSEQIIGLKFFLSLKSIQL